MNGSQIIGFGHYVPDNIIKNSEIEARFGLDAGWIEKRSGICERRYVNDDQALTDIAYGAAKMAIEQSGYGLDEFAMLLLATSTPDHLLPPSAPLLAHKLGLANAGAIDLAGACSGFLYALTLGDGFVQTQNKPVLIVAANILSKRINPDEIASAILFADGAGAVVLAPKPDAKSCILSAKLVSDATDYDLIKIPAGGSRQPFSDDTQLMDTRMTMQDGKKVFAHAVEMMSDVSQHCLNEANIGAADIQHFIPHQANIRIINKVSDRLAIEASKVAISLDKYGNSSAATIPLTLSLYHQRGLIKPNDIILMATIGAGFIGGATLLRV
ncbi:MAG: beta-ketoacyl-ACP synthase III [Rhizobiales bacterium]|nr:beta-ketoacyl-ACP synthase III [Hyphomicrobiales bacterium]NRB13727.1 beta-ketoacyl-ACP synthase III [Hyphomicrobiales bacterium]